LNISKALDLNMDGLMIETHHTPDDAWSDAAQQVTPESLIQMMKDLKVRKPKMEEESYSNELDELRAKIDVADHEIIEQLGKRMEVADKIGSLKKERNVAVLQSSRWNDLLENMIKEGNDHGLSKDFITKIFKAIHQESINHQEKIING